jgi:hypothetical protein
LRCGWLWCRTIASVGSKFNTQRPIICVVGIHLSEFRSFLNRDGLTRFDENKPPRIRVGQNDRCRLDRSLGRFGFIGCASCSCHRSFTPFGNVHFQRQSVCPTPVASRGWDSCRSAVRHRTPNATVSRVPFGLYHATSMSLIGTVQKPETSIFRSDCSATPQPLATLIPAKRNAE